MRISDWSSDVCSSDLLRLRARRTLEDAGGVRILERQILDVLRDHAGGGRGVRAVRLHSFLRGCPDFGPRDTFLRLERWLRLAANRETVRARSEERRVGTEWVSTGRSRGSTYHYKKKKQKQY